MQVTIEKFISIKVPKNYTRFPWTETLLNTIPGDSFISVSPFTSIMAHNTAKKLGMTVSVRREGNNFRVYRLE